MFWRRKSGKEHDRESWADPRIWEKEYKTKDDERWARSRTSTLLTSHSIM